MSRIGSVSALASTSDALTFAYQDVVNAIPVNEARHPFASSAVNRGEFEAHVGNDAETL